MRFPTMWHVRPVKPQISLRIRAVFDILNMLKKRVYNSALWLKSVLVISCRMKHIYTMFFKSYEHFHLLTTDEPTQNAIIVHKCGSCTLNTCYEDTVKRFG